MDQGSNPGREKIFFLLPICPNKVQCKTRPYSIHAKVLSGIQQLGHAVNLSPPPSVEV
jgi:hypothetical protein